MKAAVVTEAGVQIRDIPVPRPLPNEVLVRVRASALNRIDLTVASGQHHGSVGGPGSQMGLEFAGDVVEVGREVHHVRPGDRVMGSGRAGHAEYAVTDWGRVYPLPESLSFEQGATLPVALQTMHDAIVTHGRLQRGESVLIQGASSAVGLMGLQIAAHMGAATVLGTSTSRSRREQLRAWGADQAIDTTDPAWTDQVIEATQGLGVHLVVDLVSAPVVNANMRAARVQGRIVNVGRLGGARGEFDFELHALKRIQYVGVTFRTRSVEEVREITRRAREDLWGAVAAGQLHLPIHRTFALGEVAEALACMGTNAHFGKLVLTM